MTYPPLTPLDKYPLHRGETESNWACMLAKDGRINHVPFEEQCFDWRCRDCVLWALYATIQLSDEHPMEWNPDWDSPPQQVTLGWMIDRSLFWFEEGRHNEPRATPPT